MIKCAACLREATQTVGDHVFCDNCAAMNLEKEKQEWQECELMADYMNEDEGRHDR